MIKKYIQYIKDNPEGYWFKAKAFGYGWVPAKWQGWAILLIYLVLVLIFALTLDEASPVSEIMFTFMLPLVFLTTTLILICYKTGEKPAWRWGIPDPKNTKK